MGWYVAGRQLVVSDDGGLSVRSKMSFCDENYINILQILEVS